jgi:pheromone shutdown protein TraB
MAFLASHAHNLAMLSKKDRGLYSFHAAIFIAILTMNIAEATILRTTHLWWMLFTASVFEVAALTKRGNALVSRGVAPLHPSLMRSI